MPIRQFLNDNTVFEPDAIAAMSEALERASAALRVNGQAHDREIIAERRRRVGRHRRLRVLVPFRSSGPF